MSIYLKLAAISSQGTTGVYMAPLSEPFQTRTYTPPKPNSGCPMFIGRILYHYPASHIRRTLAYIVINLHLFDGNILGYLQVDI